VIKSLGSLVVVAGAAALLLQGTRLMLDERDYHSAKLWEDRGELTQAEEVYRRGLVLNPLNGRIHFGLARVLYHAGKYPEALTEAMLAERTYADSHIEVLKGYIQEGMGARRSALGTFRHAVALDPTLKNTLAEIEKLERELAGARTGAEEQ
jgi:tetratricopeptide (TPR) repeat protein